uniref:DUF1618 domain-containing protein n=1 Tax=Setaria viridis TaxID=4556 RepID=A0A4V6D3T4_SETVI|nr:LOW QUALITY PROTEIN: hypothetical protein SEVIR_9G097300v2 [Setaria viridis]
MIPYLPRGLKATYTLAAVPVRGGAGAGLALALMARLVGPQDVGSGRICVCTPAARTPEPDIAGAWQAKVHRFRRLREPFSADVVFSLHDKVFWADLSQGVAYSDLGAAAGDSAAVATVFISLPDEYQVEYPQRMGSGPARMSRTIGCVEDAIKFVCIDRRDPGNETVKMLTLDLDRRLWEEDEGLTCPWKRPLEAGRLMNAELRDVEPLEPQYPTLLPDGSLFLLLPNGAQWLLCGFDMRSKSLHCFGLVHNYHTLGPVILPSDFFTKCYPPPCGRKLPKIFA